MKFDQLLKNKIRWVLTLSQSFCYTSQKDVTVHDIIDHKGRHQNSLPLTTNFSQKLTQPSKGISYPVGDLCRYFTKWTLHSAYTLHSIPIPSTDGTNGLLHTYQKQFINVSPACFCHPTVVNFDVSPKCRH